MARELLEEQDRRARIKEKEHRVYFSLEGKVKWRSPALCSSHTSGLSSFWEK